MVYEQTITVEPRRGHQRAVEHHKKATWLRAVLWYIRCRESEYHGSVVAWSDSLVIALWTRKHAAMRMSSVLGGSSCSAAI